MLLANATLPDGRRADVHIVDGLIASITAPRLPPADLDRRDLAGALELDRTDDGWRPADLGFKAVSEIQPLRQARHHCERIA